MPGLAFDARGGRLGRGGGFYDRLLAGRNKKSTLMGLCFAAQRVERLPLAPHDVLMDVVCTGRRVISFAGEKVVTGALSSFSVILSGGSLRAQSKDLSVPDPRFLRLLIMRVTNAKRVPPERSFDCDRASLRSG